MHAYHKTLNHENTFVRRLNRRGYPELGLFLRCGIHPGTHGGAAHAAAGRKG